MDSLYSLFLAIGVAAWSYSKLGKRAGYGNTQNVMVIVVVAFVITFIVAFTIFKFFLKI